MKSSIVLSPLIYAALFLFVICLFKPIYCKEISSVTSENGKSNFIELKNETSPNTTSEPSTSIPTSSVLPNDFSNKTLNNNPSTSEPTTLPDTKDDITTITSTNTSTTSTTVIPTTVVTPNTTVVPPTTMPTPLPCGHFDGSSFIGGIVLTLGSITIGIVAYKFYKNHNERNYQTL